MKNLFTKKALTILICMAIVLTTAIVIVFALQPRGSAAITSKWNAKKASVEVIPYARRAIEIIDEYLGFKITSTDAKKAFSDLNSRISTLDISFDSKNYNAADEIVDTCILYLYISADEMSDTSFWLYRDILSAQIGESVSGRTYAAQYLMQTDADQTCSIFFKNHLVSSCRYTSHETDTYTSVSAEFDYLNGVGITALYDILECAWLEIPKDSGDHIYSITISYKYYGQEVFSVSAFKSAAENTFFISKPIDFHTLSEDEYLSISEKSSIEIASLQDVGVELAKMNRNFHP